MPSEFETLFADAQKFIEESEGQTFQWNGQTYTCTAGEIAEEIDHETEGRRRRLAVQIETTLEQFDGTLPATGGLIVYQSETFTVPQEIHRDAASMRFRAYRPIQ